MSIKKYIHSLPKLNPLHVGILIVVSFTVIGIVKYFGRKPQWRTVRIQVVGKDWRNIYNSYEGYRPPFWISESIRVGDKEISYTGEGVAEVIDIDQYERESPSYDMYLTVKLKGEVNKKRQKFIYKGNAVEVGAPISLSLNDTALYGQVIDNNVTNGEYIKKYMIVTLRKKNAEPWIAEKVIPNIVQINKYNGTIIAQVLEINTESALSQLLFTQTNNPNLFLEKNTRVIDLVVKVKLFVEQHGDLWYFGGHQIVKTGASLWLYFPDVNLAGVEIQNVEDIR